MWKGAFDFVFDAHLGVEPQHYCRYVFFSQSYLLVRLNLALYQWLFLPKAMLNSKNKTKRPMFMGHLVSFYVFLSTLDVEESVTDKGKTTHYVTFRHRESSWEKNETKRPGKRGRLIFMILNNAFGRPLWSLSQLCCSCLLFLILSSCLSQSLLIISARFCQKPSWTPNATKRTIFTGRLVLFYVFDSFLDF